MAHTTRDREKLLRRVRGIRGQLEAVERTLGGRHECADLLRQVSACRGSPSLAECISCHMDRGTLSESASRIRQSAIRPFPRQQSFRRRSSAARRRRSATLCSISFRCSSVIRSTPEHSFALSVESCRSSRIWSSLKPKSRHRRMNRSRRK
jgi:FrmR/RcnR family transcriptional regulator, repressor of rcnA expression